jgi:Cu(I)/Ag(I) efflux system membrane protein CusA/SilA
MAVGYIALFGIAVETGVVMVVYLHEALEHKLQSERPLTNADVEAAAIEGAVHRLRPKLRRSAPFSPAWFRSSGNPASAPMS